jgi:urease accessory protein
MIARLIRRATLAAPLCLIAAAPASAHHVMGGRLPSTFGEGLLSGLGHPVIGPDHLAFLVAVGVVTGLNRINLAWPALFVAAMALGVGAHVYGLGIPGAEIAVALSVLLAGYLIARGRVVPAAGWAALFAFAGFLHGYAFGESIYGAETSPLGAYLFGLVLIQSVLAVGVAILVRRMGSGESQLAPRLAGAAVVGVGFTALIGQLIPGA